MQIGDLVDVRYPDAQRVVGSIAEIVGVTAKVRLVGAHGESAVIVHKNRIGANGPNRWKLNLFKGP